MARHTVVIGGHPERDFDTHEAAVAYVEGLEGVGKIYVYHTFNAGPYNGVGRDFKTRKHNGHVATIYDRDYFNR